MAVPTLRLINTVDNQKVILVKPNDIIGRNAQLARHPIADVTVSRQHCQFDYWDGRWWLFDLQSFNGTFVNGKRINGDGYELQDGDRLRIGNAGLVVDTTFQEQE